MSKTAFVFSGQGAQFPGMGKDLYENSPAAKKIFDTLENLRPGTISQCFNGTQEELNQTVNTQPCMFAVSLAAAESFKEQGFVASAIAGFSVGELAALTFAGAINIQDGFNLVCKRAEIMNAAALKTKGSMAAVLRLESKKTEELCKSAGVYPVNYNCPQQVVVAGEAEKMAAFISEVSQNGGRALPLAVSGAFHSPLMSEASAQFADVLKTVKFYAPKIPVYANITARPYGDGIAAILSKQMDSPVLWQTTVENMLADGITEFNETGPGIVLTGLIAKIRG